MAEPYRAKRLVIWDADGVFYSYDSTTTDNPLEARTWLAPCDDLRTALATTKVLFSTFNWTYGDLSVKVRPIVDQSAVDLLIDEEIRQRLLASLTDEQRRILGIPAFSGSNFNPLGKAP